MIRAIIEVKLIYPYKQSLTALLEFNNLWQCNILRGGTKKEKAVMSMPTMKFKKIFGVNPQKGEYEVPRNMKHFISSVRVKKIQTT